MSNSLQATLGQPVAGLGNFTFTIVNDGDYTLRFNTTIPLGSAVQAEVKLNATSKYLIGGATDNPTPTQQSMGGAVTMACVAGDVVHFILTSANAVDGLPNAVKSVVNLYQGF